MSDVGAEGEENPRLLLAPVIIFVSIDDYSARVRSSRRPPSYFNIPYKIHNKDLVYIH